jgi:tetratricopeptide (TPR) repeat protein
VKNSFKYRRISERMLPFFLSSIIIILAGMPLFSQDSGVKSSRQSSMEAFSKGDFEKASSGFSELLATYPKDPLYKYYSGVCLVRLNRDPDKAATLLNEARQGGSVARIVPSDAIYWQGRALQMTGKYAEAIECFNSFGQVSGKKAARELNVSDYIEQCNRKEGQLLSSEPVEPDKVNEPAHEPEITTVKPVESVSRIEEPVHNLTSQDSIPASYDAILSDAMSFHIKADSLYRIADSLKKNIENLSFRERSELRSKIEYLENNAVSLQLHADKKYAEAQASMNTTPFVSAAAETKKVPAEKDSVPVLIKVVEPVKPEPVNTGFVRKDSVLTAQAGGQQVFSLFGILASPDVSGKKVKVDAAIPAGLVYRIQLGVFTSPMALSYFKGITPIYGFRVAGTNKTNYYAGMFRRKADAGKALSVVRQKGFSDAFIISLLDGNPVSSDRAAHLEKEWGQKPFRVDMQTRMEVPADTIPPTLSFRVLIMSSPKPVKDDVLDGMKKIAGSRGLDSQTLADGTVIYMAGHFITFDSAEAYAELLEKNGYREAKVTAWLGKKEIPVETARQLFENLE